MGAKQKKPRKHPAKEARRNQLIMEYEKKALEKVFDELLKSQQGKK